MAADGGANAVDNNLAVQMREFRLHKIGDGAGVLVAGGFGNEAFAGIVVTVLGMGFHFLDDLLDDRLFAADLLARDEMPLVIHIQQRADLQRRAEPAGRLGNAPALDIEGQVGGKEPVMQLELVLLGKIAHLFQALAGIAQVRQRVHQQAVAGRSAQGIHDVELALGIFFPQLLGRDAGGIDRAAETGRKADMQDVPPLLQHGFKIRQKFIDIDLGGLCFLAGGHAGVKLLERDALTQVIGVAGTAQGVVEADIADIAFFKVFFAEVCRGTAAENIFRHEDFLLCFFADNG